MSDETTTDNQNTTQNPISEENSIPPSSQEPTEQGTENIAYSEPTEALPEALESSPSDFKVKSNDIPPPDSTHIEPEKEPEIPLEQTGPQANPASNGTGPSKPEPETAQIPPNEPLNPQPDPIKSEPVSVFNYGEAKAEPENINPIPVIIPSKNKVLELLNKAKLAIQFRKRKKLDRVMTLFLKQSKITNDEVEKFLHVSDATATRYLSQLEKEGKIKQSGKTGKSVFYIKI